MRDITPLHRIGQVFFNILKPYDVAKIHVSSVLDYTKVMKKSETEKRDFFPAMLYAYFYFRSPF
jgi:chloramphenicol O-acetyltransferase